MKEKQENFTDESNMKEKPKNFTDEFKQFYKSEHNKVIEFELNKNEFDLINIKAGERVKKGNVSTRLICRLSMNILGLQ